MTFCKVHYNVSNNPRSSVMAGMTDSAVKSFAVKFVGSNKATENLQATPGTTVSDVLGKLNLSGGYQLSDAKDQDRVFAASDNLYALIDDGALLYASSHVTAGAH